MSRYIRFEIENLAPVRIADDETSQHGQTDTLKYIPGSTLRGLVVNSLAAKKELFEKYKIQLFSDKVHFMNAYLMAAERELIPSLKGFYEDKRDCEGKKTIENVVLNDVAPGTKRASLGHYCYVENDCVFYTDVQTGEDLNINTSKENRTVFRSQYIKKGQCFAGYITFDDGIEEELISLIQDVFQGTVYIGNKRSAGYGACRCLNADVKNGMPYESFRKTQKMDKFFLVLLSDTVMVNEFGEMTGLYLPELAEELGCTELEIERCATSIREVHGYNRVWKGTVPSAVMYEAGSVFYIKASEEIPADNFRKLEEKGIGIRKNEGFGQIAIMDSYKTIAFKQKFEAENAEIKLESPAGFASEIQSDLKNSARSYLQYRTEKAIEKYIVEDESTGNLKRISGSKRGTVEALCMQFRYNPQDAQKLLQSYVRHSEVKDGRVKVHDGKKRQDLYAYVDWILNTDLNEILNLKWKENKIFGIHVKDIFSAEDEIKYKLKLLIDQIRYVNRKEKSDAE